MNDAYHHYQPEPGQTVDVTQWDPDDVGGWEKDAAKARIGELRDELRNLQERLYAEGEQSLLVVLQAMDAGGKDSTIEKVFRGVSPLGVQVTSFKQPTEEEKAHDFLWRVHKQVPRAGFISIFNRSHYEDVLIVRVNGWASPQAIERRYEHINNFERLLAESGTRILKFYLHISKAEQKERFQDRLDRPEKNWKFSVGDLPVREQWDEYMRAFSVALTRCNTDNAPWYIIPANHKWYRDLIIMQTLVDTLNDMNPQFPPPDPGLENVVIPD